MKNVLLLILIAFALTACPSAPPVDPGGGGSTTTTTLPPVVVEPPEHLPAFGLDRDGLKMGGRTIRQNELETAYGWIYIQDESGKWVPDKEVPVAIFWFAGCIGGMCNDLVGPIKTNSFGYVALTGNHLIDTFAIRSKPGEYGVCNGDKPLAGGGSALPRPGESFKVQAFRQYKITPYSCKPGPMTKLMGVFGLADVEPQVEDGVPYFKDDNTVCLLISGEEKCKSVE